MPIARNTYRAALVAAALSCAGHAGASALGDDQRADPRPRAWHDAWRADAGMPKARGASQSARLRWAHR